MDFTAEQFFEAIQDFICVFQIEESIKKEIEILLNDFSNFV